MLRWITVLVLGSGALTAQATPRLLADLDPTPGPPLSSNPGSFAQFGAWTFFAADDGVHGRELFRTAGTAASTALFADLCPGVAGSDPRELTQAGQKLFFAADDGVHGSEPWVTDGTPAGTRMLIDLYPGRLGNGIINSRALGSRCLFLGVPPTGFELWASDGTPAGTVPLFDPSNSGGLSPSSALAVIATPNGPRSLFVAYAAPRTELWMTDGTRSGTVPAVALPQWTDSIIREIGATSRSVVFAVVPRASPSIASVWISDGTTAGTFMVHGRTRSEIRWGWWNGAPLPELDGLTWFPAYDRTFAWITDGTPGGTRPVNYPVGYTTPMSGWFGRAAGALWLLAVNRLIRVDPYSAVPVDAGPLPFSLSASGSPHGAARLGNFYLLYDRNDALQALDVRTATSVRLSGASTSTLTSPTVSNGRAYFGHEDPAIGDEPMVSDGTLAGTGALVDLNPRRGVTRDTDIAAFLSFGRWTAIVERLSSTQPQPRLWCTDGTTAGTQQVFRGRRIERLTPVGDRRYFVGEESAGTAVYVTDGTPAGTHSIPLPVAPGTWFQIEWMAAHGASLVMVALDGRQHHVYVCDGQDFRLLTTLYDTYIVVDVVSFGDRIVARTNDIGAFTLVLWFVDPNGAVSRVPVGPVAMGSDGRGIVMGDALYFRTVVPGGQELWRSDGTAVGTRRVSPLLLGVRHMDLARDRLYFVTTFGLWVSDGTTPGTRDTGIRSDFLANPIPTVGTRAIYTIRGTTSEYWSTDGTVPGTRFLFAAGATEASSRVSALSNGLFYFLARDPQAGLEPHVIDIGASVQTLGHGCGGASRQATLFADLPGSPRGGLTLGGHAAVGTSALVLMSPPPFRPLASPAIGACVLEADPNASVVLGVLPIANQVFARSYLLADDPALYGAQASLQAVIAPTDGARGIDLTNGLLLTIGR